MNNNNDNNFNPFLNTYYKDLIELQATTPSFNPNKKTDKNVKTNNKGKARVKTLNPKMKGVKRNG